MIITWIHSIMYANATIIWVFLYNKYKKTRSSFAMAAALRRGSPKVWKRCCAAALRSQCARCAARALNSLAVSAKSH